MSTKGIIDGERAKALLEDELLVRALEDIEFSYLKQWKETLFKETELREKLWLATKTVDEFRARLQATIDGGAIDAANIERKKRSEK